MSGLVFPLYIREKDDGALMEFPTHAAIQQHLEATDVENGEYEAWDATGRCVALAVGKPRRDWLKVTVIEARLSEKEFQAIKLGAERRREYQHTLLSKWLHRWLDKLRAKG